MYEEFRGDKNRKFDKKILKYYLYIFIRKDYMYKLNYYLDWTVFDSHSYIKTIIIAIYKL